MSLGLVPTPPGTAVPVSPREHEALETIRNLLGSMEAAHAMIGQLSQAVMAPHKRLEAIERKRPRLVVPG